MTVHLPLPAADLLAAHDGRLALVRQYANETNEADFRSKWLSVLERCAAWFSSVPLRPAEHAEPGGAFRATVEAAYFAMRLSGAQKFGADQTSERRRQLEPQYLYALFLAACCSRLDEPCRHFQFFRHRDGAEWVPAAHGAFGSWLGADTYHVTRREAALPVERMRTALLAREILGAERLGAFDSHVLSELFGAINPDPRPSGLETLLHKVVRQAIDTTTQFEVKARRAAFAPDATPAPAAQILAADGADAPTAPANLPRASEDTAKTVAETPSPTAGSRQDSPDTADGSPAASEPHAGVETSRNVVQLDGARSLRKEPTPEDPFKALAGTSNLMREFFKALSQDAAAGKTKVTRVEGKVAISKRSLGNYGIASDTLIEHLRKFKHLYKIVGQDILLLDEVGNLIMPGPQSDA
ncbi:TraI domain-containing protein [Cupriavidus consociatus]|uniref:TraI domain-containing protein n=1 Tax=Cupriavidus consociatus TaxID=2821357 RepID=UPI001AEA564A|nr:MULTISPECIES: TraI domain-containing protein [unclassified Cupriavidus]MBP0623414.1 TraI domain-containing protein [Cupriavidus sp. LEh25]MDK2660113.1 TraI domain-containing protein [Cupriavidus sp. LEh21]